MPRYKAEQLRLSLIRPNQRMIEQSVALVSECAKVGSRDALETMEFLLGRITALEGLNVDLKQQVWVDA